MGAGRRPLRLAPNIICSLHACASCRSQLACMRFISLAACMHVSVLVDSLHACGRTALQHEDVFTRTSYVTDPV
eukprot:359605-Chlamydomonas_euryale.AAC.2